ncbi:GNAT family N-acetyltransferase [archaeon]|nr:GNAT family N-acetyltransferase [archaeon]
MNAPQNRDCPVEDIEIIKFSDASEKSAKDFDCGIKDLNDFLADDALQQQNESVNLTYLWTAKKQGVLLGYITVCNDSIHLFGEKKAEMKKIGISYKALPALKICRMAVSNNHARKGLGTKMIAFAINRVLKINEVSGCRFLTLEAKNDPSLPEEQKPIHFYKKLGFMVIKERKPNASYIPMYKDLQPVIKEAIARDGKKTFGSL